MRTTLLKHTLPDGTSHFDWLIETTPEAPLTTFRVAVRIDDPACEGFEAERLADHRRVYLDYEGEVSGGRGVVLQVARGEVRGEINADAATLHVGFGGAFRRWSGHRVSEALWRFRAECGET